MRILMVLGCLMAVSSVSTFACSEAGKDGILPENNRSIPVSEKNSQNITEEEYNAVLDKFETLYRPILEPRGATLKAERLWDSTIVNAYAGGKYPRMEITLHGGLARHPLLTSDGFVLVACHELGHHLAGAPRSTFRYNTHLSVEGQSDYFASAKCLRLFFADEDNAAALRAMTIPEALMLACQAQWSHPADAEICVRSSMAGLSFAKVSQEFESNPVALNFTKPDLTVVTSLFESHPKGQCRLDTFLQGALCSIDKSVDFSETNETIGACNASSGHSIGSRPRCWYKPKE